MHAVRKIENEELKDLSRSGNCIAIFIAAFPENRFFYCTTHEKCNRLNRTTLGWKLFEACGLISKTQDKSNLSKEEYLRKFKKKFLLYDIFSSPRYARRIESSDNYYERKAARIIAKLKKLSSSSHRKEIKIIRAIASPRGKRYAEKKRALKIFKKMKANKSNMFQFYDFKSPWSNDWASRANELLSVDNDLLRMRNSKKVAIARKTTPSRKRTIHR